MSRYIVDEPRPKAGKAHADRTRLAREPTDSQLRSLPPTSDTWFDPRVRLYEPYDSTYEKLHVSANVRPAEQDKISHASGQTRLRWRGRPFAPV